MANGMKYWSAVTILPALFFLSACNPWGLLGDRPPIPDGRVEALDASGQKRYEKEWRAKKRHGTWRDYGADEVLLQEHSYQHGKRTGVWSTWYQNGQLRSRGSFADDKETGLWEAWHENGQLSFSGSYVAGKPHGLARTYDEEGELVSEMEWDHGQAVTEDSPAEE
jgi:antitoxin component YwqK of YwqJK toxin-antitoxin module